MLNVLKNDYCCYISHSIELDAINASLIERHSFLLDPLALSMQSASTAVHALCLRLMRFSEIRVVEHTNIWTLATGADVALVSIQ